MKGFVRIALAAALVALPATQAAAGWKLIAAKESVQVAKSKMAVTPNEAWNRGTHRASKKGETWTLDGPSISEVYFAAALLPGETFYKDTDKKNHPLPMMGKNLQLTDIPEFYESSQRIAYSTSVYEVTGIEPMKFLGQDGVKFSYTFALQGNPLQYKGLARATLIKGQLYLISYDAPALSFFDRDRAKAEAIMDSARL
ncbi:MAG: hypothetical protein ABI673_02150 [Novosphingobium sp.]